MERLTYSRCRYAAFCFSTDLQVDEARAAVPSGGAENAWTPPGADLSPASLVERELQLPFPPEVEPRSAATATSALQRGASSWCFVSLATTSQPDPLVQENTCFAAGGPLKVGHAAPACQLRRDPLGPGQQLLGPLGGIRCPHYAGLSRGSGHPAATQPSGCAPA